MHLLGGRKTAHLFEQVHPFRKSPPKSSLGALGQAYALHQELIGQSDVCGDCYRTAAGQLLVYVEDQPHTRLWLCDDTHDCRAKATICPAK